MALFRGGIATKAHCMLAVLRWTAQVWMITSRGMRNLLISKLRGAPGRVVDRLAGLEALRRVVGRCPGAALLILLVLSVGLLVLSFSSMLRAHEPVLIDYQVYRWAVHTWLNGGDIQNGGPITSVGMLLPWVYPTFALLPLSLIALAPFGVGAGLLYVLDVLALGGSLFMIAKCVWPEWGNRRAFAVAMPVLPFSLFLE